MSEENTITRVRYTKKDNTLTSKKMLGSANTITVNIDLDTLSYALVSGSGELLTMGAAKNLPAVKRMVKTQLRNFGVKFMDEVRNVVGDDLEEVEEKVETPKQVSSWG